MPTEYELKFVLNDPKGELVTRLLAEHDSHHLEQFYLSDGARFRSSRTVRLGRAVSEPAELIFCYKRKIRNQVLEIETVVSNSDYQLARQASDPRNTLNKLRFKIADGKGQWDVDFFLVDAGSGADQLIYFAMAEYECQPGTTVVVPDWLRPYVAVAVPYAQSANYSSRKLCDRASARNLMTLALEGRVVGLSGKAPAF